MGGDLRAELVQWYLAGWRGGDGRTRVGDLKHHEPLKETGDMWIRKGPKHSGWGWR